MFCYRDVYHYVHSIDIYFFPLIKALRHHLTLASNLFLKISVLPILLKQSEHI